MEEDEQDIEEAWNWKLDSPLSDGLGRAVNWLVILGRGGGGGEGLPSTRKMKGLMKVFSCVPCCFFVLI